MKFDILISNNNSLLLLHHILVLFLKYALSLTNDPKPEYSQIPDGEHFNFLAGGREKKGVETNGNETEWPENVRESG